jgi:uncharacterized protein YraI
MKASTCLRLSVGAFLFTLSFTALAQNAETTDVASVRAGPDTSYPEVAELDAGTPIQVMGCLDDWSWCDVAFGDNRGWVYAPDITYAYQGGYVPFYSYAPGLGVPVVAFSLDSYWGSHYHDRPWYSQREEWAHRPMHHQRPSGPPPSSSPPPREAVRSDRPERPGGAGERPGRPADRPDRNAGRADTRAPEPRPQDHVQPPTQHPDMNSKPAERAPPQSQRDDAQARPSGRPEPQRHEEQQHPAPPHPEPKNQEGPPRAD